MPELAEVAYFARQWDAGEGKRILAVETHAKSRVFRGSDAKKIGAALEGARLKAAHTHGKQMLFEFSGGHWLTLHLGMTGSLETKKEPYTQGKHDHLVLHTKELALVFNDPRQFGAVRYHHGKAAPDAWRSLPPQPMDGAFTAVLVFKTLQRHKRVPLKALLLDQRYFPGIGNWMADEILWQAKIAPHVLSGDVSEKQAHTVWNVTRKICSVSMKTIAKNWSDPPKSWLMLHRWQDGGKCPRCGSALKRETVRGRTACWCPKCQG
jgi:formamidopyrimidine-DNA glycosylase